VRVAVMFYQVNWTFASKANSICAKLYIEHACENMAKYYLLLS